MSSTNTSWLTNFYYGQELRSMHMNSLFNSGFKPGIYNANMYIFTKSTADAEDDIKAGVHLFVGKGTTLIFTNNIVSNGDRHHRDYDTPGTYYIKCTAPKDLTMPIAELSSGTVTGIGDTYNNYILGLTTGNCSPRKLYLGFTLMYNSESDLGQAYYYPTLTVTRDNLYYRNTLYTEEDAPTSGPAFYREYNSYNLYFCNFENVSPPIYDGSDLEGTVNLTPQAGLSFLSYLYIGDIIDTSLIPKQTDRAYASSTTSWTTTGYTNHPDINSSIVTSDSAAESWMMNHTFIGRGFPEYRQSFISNKNIWTPELLPFGSLDKLYLDTKAIHDGSIIYETSVNDMQINYGSLEEESKKDSKFFWEDILGIGIDRTSLVDEISIGTDIDTEMIDTLPGLEPIFTNNELDMMFYLDRVIDPSNTRSYLKESNEYKIYSVAQQIADTWDKNNYTDGSNIVACDIIFFATRDQYAFTDSEDMHEDSDIGGENPDHSKKLLNIFTDNNEKVTLKVVPFRWISNLDQNDNSLVATLLSSYKYDKPEDDDGITNIITLDVSEKNTDRLLKFVENKNIIPLAVDYMRQHPNESPYIDVRDNTTLIPAMIIFRPFTINLIEGTYGEEFATHDGKLVQLTPLDTISRDYMPKGHPLVADSTSEVKPRFNPANILSFFDIQFKSFKVNSIDFRVENVYSTVSVIE